MNIDQIVIDEIVSKSDIVSIIGQYVKLKKSGVNYFACCPFHQEKSPSFSVNSVKQFFHCFGCGVSGNVITFVMKYTNMEFIDVVKSLATNAGVTIPDTPNKSYNQQETAIVKQYKLNLNETLTQIVSFYQVSLTNSKFAQHYLTSREIKPESMQKFSIGYAPNNPTALATIFTNYNTNEVLNNIGMVITTDNGKYFDRFRDRIMFPIRNIKGEIVGFGGRIIAKGEPKYLNSPESPLFNKSLELYGLFEAQKSIRTHSQVIIVEGYMDVIALSQAGIDNVVAVMGTTISEDHIKKLLRLCNDIYYCFDGDVAGHKAATRALERSMPYVTDIKSVNFIFLPDNEDPDSFIRKHGMLKFQEYKTRNSRTLSSFLFHQLSTQVNLTTNEGKAKCISLAKPFIEKLTTPALQVLLKNNLAQLIDISPSVLENILNNRSRYAFYTYNVRHQVLKAQLMPKLNVIKFIITHAIKHIDWVLNYKLPDNIYAYSPEIQELILFLDFLSNNYDITTPVDMDHLNQHFAQLHIDQIQSQTIALSHEDFIHQLDKLLYRSHVRGIKVPRIAMKNTE